MNKILLLGLIIIIIFKCFYNSIFTILDRIVNKLKKDNYEITINGIKYNKNVYDVLKYNNKWVVIIRETRKSKKRKKAIDFEKWYVNTGIPNQYKKIEEKNCILETQFILIK